MTIKSFRFFSERVFGVWVDGTIIKVNPKSVKVKVYYWGHEWTETLNRECEVYYPYYHPLKGEAVKLNTLCIN